jgi:hypothetical protein
VPPGDNARRDGFHAPCWTCHGAVAGPTRITGDTSPGCLSARGEDRVLTLFPAPMQARRKKTPKCRRRDLQGKKNMPARSESLGQGQDPATIVASPFQGTGTYLSCRLKHGPPSGPSRFPGLRAGHPEFCRPTSSKRHWVHLRPLNFSRLRQNHRMTNKKHEASSHSKHLQRFSAQP